MLRSCKYCGRVHDENFSCKMKPIKRKGDRQEDSFRFSRAWKQKRAQIKARDGYLCRVCLLRQTEDQNKYKTQGLSVHHIVPLNEDFERRLDDGNLITLCKDCHDMAEKGHISRALLHRLAKEEKR